MKTSRVFKVLAILAVTGLVAGCKLEIVSVQGGDIAWDGGSCAEGSNCVIQITDPNFSKTFTVTPKPGYEFLKWQKAPGFLCGDSTAPCAVTMPADANLAAAVIGLFATGRIMPVYKDVGIDTDGDGTRNELDEDDDNDGVLDGNDTCPLTGPNEDGVGCPILDTDGDGLNEMSTRVH
jgi:Divergent InlB B-repeat domain